MRILSEVTPPRNGMAVMPFGLESYAVVDIVLNVGRYSRACRINFRGTPRMRKWNNGTRASSIRILPPFTTVLNAY
jgi:hypothetical protein